MEEVPAPRSEVGVEVRDLAEKGTITLAQLQRWTNGATRSPVDNKVKQQRLRELLEAKFTCERR